MSDRPATLLSKLALTLGGRAASWLLIAVVASLGLAGVELGISVFLQLFMKALGVLNQDVHTAALFGLASLSPSGLAVGLCVLALARSSTLFLVGQSANISMEMITARLRRIAVWEALLHPAKLFVPAASINARIGDLANKSAQFSASASVFVSASVQVIALAGVMFFTARGETLIALAGLGLVGLFVLRINRLTRRVAANVPIELRVMTEGIERVARNTTLVRVLRTERIEHRRLVTSIDAYARHLINAAYLANFAGAVTPFAGILLIIVIVGSSQRLLHTPGITLLSFLYLFVRFVQTLGGAVISFSTANANWPSFEDSLRFVGKFRKDEVAAAMLKEAPLTGRATERTASVDGDAPAIAIRGVTFRYPGSSQDVVRGLSADIAPGSQLGIVGPSGCGKSTLLGLVLGLFEPSGGTITIGGRSSKDYFADARVRIGYVGAEAFLVAGTVRDNLRYGISIEAKDEDLWAALAEAQLRNVVEELPGQLDYLIAEDGSGLSAGQKQRLCLARALLGKPHLLVLDEVSANLDTDTERLIAESLKGLRGSCTTILVSHRKGILAYADPVINLEAQNT
ncbi:MAG: transporter ATP-binding protein [Labilithrix sp.]|nr:transporter ATP-binding protein [Labilithrix sp.]